MKSHIVGTVSKPVNETRNERLSRLQIARGIRDARKKKKPEPEEPVEVKDASILKSLG